MRRFRMRAATGIVVAMCCVLSPQALASQQRLNPAYLSDLPTAERVKREIKGADAMDTAARQSGALAHLQEIIYTIALAKGRNRDRLLPDEKRLADQYYADSFYALEPFEKELVKTPEGKQTLLKLHGYKRAPAIRDEVLKRLVTPAVVAEYNAAEDFLNARHKAFVKAQTAPDPPATPPKPVGDDPVARCIASGRNALDCTAQAMSQGFRDLMGIAGAPVPATAPGLRLNGRYTGGGGFALGFSHESVIVSCGRLIPEAHAYTIDRKGAEIVVTVQADPKPIVFSYRTDKSLQGPVAVTVAGHIVTGTRHFNRHYADGTVVPMEETLTAPFTSACGAGSMPTRGAQEALTGANMPVLGALAQGVSDAKTFAPVAGLRVSGMFVGTSGLSLEFNADQSVIVQCRAALVARDYTVDWKPAGISVTIQHGGQPIVFTVQPDGSLAGSGNVVVTGRVLTGLAETSVQFRTATDTCASGVLTAKR